MVTERQDDNTRPVGAAQQPTTNTELDKHINLLLSALLIVTGERIEPMKKEIATGFKNLFDDYANRLATEARIDELEALGEYKGNYGDDWMSDKIEARLKALQASLNKKEEV
jgi:hypothetical protein